MNTISLTKVWLWVVICLMVLGLVYQFLPDYSRNSLVHGYADTDDYKIFENSIVEAGDPCPWPVSSKYNQMAVGEELMDSILHFQPYALLVVRDDSILWEKYFNGHTETSFSNIFSSTKSIVALLAGCAIRDGLILGIEAAVSDFLPEFGDRKYGVEMKLTHLLSMTSGLDYHEGYASPFSPTTRSYYGTDLETQMMELNLKNKPGTQYAYASANTQILGMVLRKVTGKSLAEYASQQLWTPLQAERSALWSLDRKGGMEKAFCCFSATARDLARIGQLVCDSGVWKGRQIITRDYYNRMIRPLAGITDEKGDTVNYYALHWWLTQWEGEEVIYARGIRGQYIIAVPSRKLVIVRQGNKRSPHQQAHHRRDIYLYLRAGFEIDLKAV